MKPAEKKILKKAIKQLENLGSSKKIISQLQIALNNDQTVPLGRKEQRGEEQKAEWHHYAKNYSQDCLERLEYEHEQENKKKPQFSEWSDSDSDSQELQSPKQNLRNTTEEARVLRLTDDYHRDLSNAYSQDDRERLEVEYEKEMRGYSPSPYSRWFD